MSIDVAKLVKEAAEAVKELPDHLQEAAFNRAYTTLFEAAQKEASPGDTEKPHRTRSPASKERAKPNAKKAKSNGTAAPSKQGGPAGQMTYLLEANFFDTPRTIRDIIETVKDARGRTLKPNEVSPVLLRWLRAEKLARKKNEEGQYEYTSA